MMSDEMATMPETPEELQDLLRSIGANISVFTDGPIVRPRTNAEVCHNINLYWKNRLKRRHRISPMGL